MSNKGFNNLVLDNLSLVHFVINKYYKRTNIEYDDLASSGNIGLVKAAKTFKLDKNITFSTYATRCIINEINLMYRSECLITSVSLHTPLKVDEGLELFDLVSNQCDNTDSIVEKSNTMEILFKALDMVSDRDRYILKSLFSIFGCASKTQYELSIELEYSQPHVSRLTKIAIANYSNVLKEHFGLDYSDLVDECYDNVEYCTGGDCLVTISKNVFDALNDQDKFLVGSYHGLYGYKKRSVRDISDIMNIEFRRVRKRLDSIYYELINGEIDINLSLKKERNYDEKI